MMKLLLVEDDEDSVELVKTALEMAQLPIELNVAYDGEEALVYLKKKLESPRPELPDLVVLDLNLPRKNGRELLSDLRASTSLTNLAIVLLTTTEWHDDLKREYTSLQKQCYSKPMRFQEYMDLFREIHQRWLAGSLKGLNEG
jgi:chemotaxis family two-component system response regulator Rcp1